VINGTYGIPAIENNLENSVKNQQFLLKHVFISFQAQWDKRYPKKNLP
jgi:hypothetical protein